MDVNRRKPETEGVFCLEFSTVAIRTVQYSAAGAYVAVSVVFCIFWGFHTAPRAHPRYLSIGRLDIMTNRIYIQSFGSLLFSCTARRNATIMATCM